MPKQTISSKLILGSRSPMRARMLREAGVGFEVRVPSFNDPADPAEAHGHGVDAQVVACGLAKQKLESLLNEGDFAGAVVLCADTVGCDSAGRLVGTPESAEEAEAMLRSLFNASHAIATGVALWSATVPNNIPGKATGEIPGAVWGDTSTVTIGQVSDEALRAYIDSGDWAGKAGGYNLAERVAAGWPITCEGDPDTVMGLPMRRLLPALAALGVVPDADSESTPSTASAGAR